MKKIHCFLLMIFSLYLNAIENTYSTEKKKDIQKLIHSGASYPAEIREKLKDKFNLEKHPEDIQVDENNISLVTYNFTIKSTNPNTSLKQLEVTLNTETSEFSYEEK